MKSSAKIDIFGGPWMVAFMVVPGMSLFAVFVLWPTLNALLVSMQSWTGFSPQSQFVGLQNYASLIEDRRFWQSLANTLYYVVLGGIGHFAFAFLFASALNSPRFAGKKIYQTLIFFPAFISVVGVAILWSRLYSTTDGLINQLLAGFGVEPGIEWLSDRNAINSIIISSIWAGVGGQMILILAGMRRIPATYYEAARIDGANEIHLFWHVTLPMLKDVTYVALSLWLIGSMQVFGLVQALDGPDVTIELETVSTYQYAIAFNAQDNIYMMGRGTAMAIILVIIIVLLVGAARMAFGRRELEY